MKTRKPTGKPPWPILLLAGVEKAGKTYSAAAASGSDLIGHTYWIGVGEDDPDEYGAIPGARFDIVEHDGTHRSILAAVTEASAQPKVDGKPNLLVLDSASRLWALLSDQAQATANERAKRKGRNVSQDGADITMDLWNVATQRWNHILDALREHDGPVIITARLEEVTVVENGQPTKDKTWKVQAQKGLAYDVGVIVQLRAFGEAYLTGVRSLKYRPKPADLTAMPGDWTVDFIWRQLGLADDVGARTHAHTDSTPPEVERDTLLAEIKNLAEKAGVGLDLIAKEWAESHDGQPIAQAVDLGGLELVRDDLRGRAA